MTFRVQLVKPTIGRPSWSSDSNIPVEFANGTRCAEVADSGKATLMIRSVLFVAIASTRAEARALLKFKNQR